VFVKDLPLLSASFQPGIAGEIFISSKNHHNAFLKPLRWFYKSITMVLLKHCDGLRKAL
jgi:hypothetical protein